jgi:hypothetical protein
MLHRIEQSPFAHGEARQDTGAPHDGEPQNVDFGFLAKSLISQCQMLIATGYLDAI